MSKFTSYYQSPLGMLEIEATETALVAVKFMEEEIVCYVAEKKGSDLIDRTNLQLTEYFESKRKQFDLPLEFAGTEFQQQVWQELTHIQFGQTMSYGRFSELLGSKQLVRAAGTAIGRNPIGIIVPCHRIIGSQGDLVGYGGGLWRKQWLLEHEGCQKLLPW